ncbi:molybdopterin converting factor subunit 1 [Paraburkholderia caledonica]|uniref:molybdopterin converting factor subunit 1 n=1 Tax=Paraburkholderia caledonica TaxID=134536 RepID=UPI000380464D|nr:molybdopterin converting factor subunit 1 [Paraburkholderia caledonica]
MKLTIKYFASVREQLDVAQETIEIDAQHITIDGLRKRLVASGPRVAEALREDKPVRVAVNQEMVTSSFVIRQDSEIAFFPPVTGG